MKTEKSFPVFWTFFWIPQKTEPTFSDWDKFSASLPRVKSNPGHPRVSAEDAKLGIEIPSRPGSTCGHLDSWKMIILSVVLFVLDNFLQPLEHEFVKGLSIDLLPGVVAGLQIFIVQLKCVREKMRHWHKKN